MFRKKPSDAPTHEQRLAEAADNTGMVYAIFDGLVDQLDASTDEAMRVRAEAVAEVERLQRVIALADGESVRAQTVAGRIRHLIDTEV